MTDDELDFCTLCGPLADAMEMLDDGNIAGARAIMERFLQRAQELCDRDKNKK
ncbi:hypothetical protein OBV_19060 [Oscillibacter valericigenes Sjm18-20]|nr:hypothetical protein OBV_19060 [Oscillibacter valericigenes Sjm18-20]